MARLKASGVESIKQDRLDCISCLRRGEFAYAREHLNKLLVYMQPEFRHEVRGQYERSNYIRVADLLEYLWTTVELPSPQVDMPDESVSEE